MAIGTPKTIFNKNSMPKGPEQYTSPESEIETRKEQLEER